ncbi:hypothetical protein CHCC20375_0857 [Bacillus licheniformis]|nr:hypothetical protein CHCC20375_0857 [Bacillus licheniformis]
MIISFFPILSGQGSLETRRTAEILSSFRWNDKKAPSD